jgi:methionine-rich copper-binding protein CopC
VSRTLIRPTLIVLTLAGIVVFTAPARLALAHAEPERANPPIGGTVAMAPTTVEVWFTEEVDAAGTTLTVVGPNGTQVDRGDTTLDLNDPERKHVTVSLAPDLPAGVYTVQWASLSAEDQDPDSGEFTFTVEGGSPVASPSASPAASPAALDAATRTPAATTGAEDGNDFDSQAFAIAVGAGGLAALFIYLFWRLVRPRPTR